MIIAPSSWAKGDYFKYSTLFTAEKAKEGVQSDMFQKKQLMTWGSFLSFLLILSLSGCTSAIQKKKFATFNDLYASGQYQEAATVEVKEKSEVKDLLPALQAAAALRYAREYNQSSLLFDQCESLIKEHNEQLLVANSAATLGSVLINDTIRDYQGTEYDGIMVNTYKALNFWQEGNSALARVEFNRALDRQRRAKERFATEIKKQKVDLEKKQEQENAKAEARAKMNKNGEKANVPAMDINKNVNNPEIDKILQEKYSSLYEFKTYPDFINPFTTYMASLFFMSEKEYSKAATLLKETYGMVGDNETVQDDFLTIEKKLDGQKNNIPHTWIIFENGLGPEKEEFRIDLPILLFTDKVKYSGIALPKLKFRDQAYQDLTIVSNGQSLCKTSLLASMDRVVQTEFKKKYTATVTRAVVSTLVKTYGQYLAQKQFGDIGGFAAAIFQGLTTSADIRIWTALPKEFQIAKIQTPDNGKLVLETPTGDKINITVSPDKNTLVFVKIPKTGAKVVHDIITM